jgi:hypothetical protein
VASEISQAPNEDLKIGIFQCGCDARLLLKNRFREQWCKFKITLVQPMFPVLALLQVRVAPAIRVPSALCNATSGEA